MSKKINYLPIALLTCYFGKWPWYFPYFLHSCKFNPTVDFIIITDNSIPIENKPDNVLIYVKTLDEIKTIASVKLGFKVSINEPYKLCDFKPAYGLLFSEVVSGYEFWGHGDIDIIYGNIRNFITRKVLNKHELITARHDFLSGTFTLFKNTPKMNMLFMQSRDYKEVFSSPEHYCFDECNFLWRQIGELKQGESIFNLPCEIDSMTHVIRRLQLRNEIDAFFDFMIVEGRPGKLKWEKGKLFFKNTFEILLYHLIKFKKETLPSKVVNPIPDTFYISPNKIYSKHSNAKNFPTI